MITSLNWYDILILLGVPTLAAALVQWLFTKVNKKYFEKSAANANLAKGTQALLRHNLLRYGNLYLKMGKIDVAHLQDYENMYEAYHNLGQNGVMDNLHDRVQKLEIVEKIDIDFRGDSSQG